MNEITQTPKLRDPFAKYSELTVQKEAATEQKPSAVAITSLDIAERTEKEHKNVLADIREMLVALDLRSAEFSADLPDSYGRMQPVFILPKREALILATGYSTKLRAAVIDRLEELEAESKTLETLTAKVDTLLYERPPIPTTATPFLTTSGYEELKALALKDAQWEVRSIVGRQLRSYLYTLLAKTAGDDDDDNDLESPNQAEWIVMNTVLFIENAVKLLELERGVKAAKGKPYVSRLSGHKWEQPKLTPQSKPSDM